MIEIREYTKLEKFKFIIKDKVTEQTYLMILEHLFDYTIEYKTYNACKLRWAIEGERVISLWIPMSCMPTIVID